jgi:serine/threonine protein kinase
VAYPIFHQERTSENVCSLFHHSVILLGVMRPQDPFIGRDILEGQFQIVQKIGSGGMGAVYRAVQPAMNRMVAVKILHPKLTTRKDIVSRFRREARAMSQLTHPNTVKVFLYGELDNGSLYIVMEFLEGKNLNQSVRSEGAFAMDRALTILIAVCGALDEAHNAGIIHRDLKPENVFICQSAGLKDFPKVLDFGLAKVGERQMRPGSVVLTQEGMVFGTPEFMSPEQAQGKTLTPASDIYSLAVILYEVLTGKLPFDAKAALDFIQLHVQAPPIKLSERVAGKTFPPLLDAIMERALAKKPEERFTTAAQFAEALQVVLRGGTALPPHLALPAPMISQPSLPTAGPAKPADHAGKMAPMPPLPPGAGTRPARRYKRGRLDRPLTTGAPLRDPTWGCSSSSPSSRSGLASFSRWSSSSL